MRRVELGELEGARTEELVRRDGQPRLGGRGSVAAGGPRLAIDLRGPLAIGPAIGTRAANQGIAPRDEARRVHRVDGRIEEAVELHLLQIRADDEGNAARGPRGDRRE